MNTVKTKYVVVNNEGIETPIIFPTHLKHSLFGALCPISAGFSQVVDGKACCYGESVSLGLKSRVVDAILIDMQLL